MVMICVQGLDINTFENLRSKTQLTSRVTTKATEQHLSVLLLVDQYFANEGFGELLFLQFSLSH